MQTHVRGTISIVKFIQNLYMHAIIFAKAIIVKVDIKLDKSTMYLKAVAKSFKKKSFIYHRTNILRLTLTPFILKLAVSGNNIVFHSVNKSILAHSIVSFLHFLDNFRYYQGYVKVFCKKNNNQKSLSLIFLLSNSNISFPDGMSIFFT